MKFLLGSVFLMVIGMCMVIYLADIKSSLTILGVYLVIIGAAIFGHVLKGLE